MLKIIFRNFRFFYLFTFLLMITGIALASTTGKIAGIITDIENKKPLAGVNIFIEGMNLGSASDNEGYFSIINVPPGEYSVSASFIGYAAITQTEVRVKIDRTTILEFEMKEVLLEGEVVTIVAQKPSVERDLTASKQTLSGDDVNNSWATNLQDAISDLPGININGGVRGSFGLDVVYALDGMDMRDVGSNTNFTAVNLSTIQEVEVLTGGWNAEYGQANGALVNIVTKKATDRLHGIAEYRLRPAGVYHWGDNIFDENNVFRSIMTTPEFWDPNSTWKTKWMDQPLPGYDGGIEPYRSMTPEERAAWWSKFVNDSKNSPQMDYAERMQWEQEITLFGPITENLGFMLSGRYKEGTGIYPSALKYNPDWTIQGGLNYQLSPDTKLSLNGVFTKFINSGQPRSYYQSSEETNLDDQEVAYIRTPYNEWKYWMYGNKGNSDVFTIRPPENAQFSNVQFKVQHIFNPNTFIDVAMQFNQMQYRLDYRDIARSAYFEDYGLPTQEIGDSLNPGYGQAPPRSFWTARWGYPGDLWRSWVDSKSYTLKADFTSQILKEHQLKAGGVFSLQELDKLLHEGAGGSGAYAQVNDMVSTVSNPYEGALYIQDKMEFAGMIVNAGLRLDFYNANKNVSSTIFDPLMLHETTPGNTGQTGLVSYDPDGTGSGYTKTKTEYAFSPRLGISFPITENSVLHFMYGKFHQRPAWQKILSNPVVWTNQVPLDEMNSDFNLPDSTLVSYRFYGFRTGNPALTWEKMTQYEIGFEQNIADMFSLDVTLYYKDAYNLTSRGIAQGPGDLVIQNSGSNVDVRLYGDPTNPDSRIPGQTISNFYVAVNGAWADIRGIELTLKSKFRFINAEVNYNFSNLSTGEYHYNRLFRVLEDGSQLGLDQYEGANNSDDGGNGIDDDAWNPHNSANLRIFAATPKNFGPEIGGVYLFENWGLGTSTRWVQGNEFTYYAPDYTGVRTPDNRRWEDRWSTNMNLSKSFDLFNEVTIKFYLQVTNLFNQKHLRRPTGQALTDYMEEGLLPVHPTTREPMVWEWYSNRPRQTNFGVNVEF